MEEPNTIKLHVTDTRIMFATDSGPIRRNVRCITGMHNGTVHQPCFLPDFTSNKVAQTSAK